MLLAKSKPGSRTRGRPQKDRRWTVDELAAEVTQSNLPMERWDGQIVMSPAPSFFHREVVDRFHDLLKGFSVSATELLARDRSDQ